MRAIGIEDLRAYLPWGQESASDCEIAEVKAAMKNIDSLSDAVQKIESAAFLRFEKNHVSVENDRFYPILRINFEGIEHDQVGLLLKLNK